MGKFITLHFKDWTPVLIAVNAITFVVSAEDRDKSYTEVGFAGDVDNFVRVAESFDEVIDAIQNARMYNTGEIVRCKECKHCDIDSDTGYAYCDAWQRGTQVDWYCSRGKAKQ